MPNWCNSIIKMEGEKDTLQKIADAINKDNDHYNKWGGLVFEELGLESPKCEHQRGFWSAASVESDVLTFIEEGAWDMTGMPKELAERLDLTIYYQCEESGNDVFYTNDEYGKYFPERYTVFEDDWCSQEYFDTEEDMIKHLCKATGREIKSLDDLKEDDGIYVNEFVIES